MKLKQMLKWNWHTGWSSVAAMYACMVIINLFFSFVKVEGDAADVRMGMLLGMDFSWLILGPIVGAMLFSYSLRWGGTNGMARRSIFLGYLLFAASLALIVPLCTFLVRTIFGGAWWNSIGVYNELFGGADAVGGVFPRIFGEYIWSVAACLCTTLIGYFFSGVFYRLGKYGKIFLCAGAPIVLFVLAPIGSLLIPAEVRQYIGELFSRVLEYFIAGPYRMALMTLGVTALFALFGWLLIRRAPINPVAAS